MRRKQARFAALFLAAGLLIPATALRAESGLHAAAARPVKTSPKPKPPPPSAAPKVVKRVPKPGRSAVAKPSHAGTKRKAASPPLRTGLHAAQTLAEPASGRGAPTLVKSVGC